MATAIPSPAGGQPSSRRAGRWLRLAVSAALVSWILWRTPFQEIRAAFADADFRFVLLALALNPLGYLASVRRWRLLIRAQGGDATLPFLVRSFLAGVFFNHLLPSTVGGDAVRAVDTARAGVERARAVAVVVVDRFLGLLALALFALMGLLVASPLTVRVPALAAWVIGGAAVLAIVAGLLFLPWRRIAKVPALLAFQGQGTTLLRAFGWSVLLQALVVLNWYFLARALQVPVPLAAFFVLVPLALFLTLLPVSINGIGVRESAWAFFLGAFGVAAAKGVALAWLDYALVLAQAVAGGMVYARRRVVRSEDAAVDGRQDR